MSHAVVWFQLSSVHAETGICSREIGRAASSPARYGKNGILEVRHIPHRDLADAALKTLHVYTTFILCMVVIGQV